LITTLSLIDLALDVPLDQGLELALAGGFSALDLSTPDCTGRPIHSVFRLAAETSVEEINSRFDAAGVKPGAWWLPVEFRGDDATYQADLQALPGWAKTAQQLRSDCCITWLWPFSDVHDYKENLAQHVARLGAVGQVLGEYGCKFGLEFIGPKTMRRGHRYEFISTLGGTLDLIDRIDLDNVGLLLDSWQWYTSQGSLEDLAALTKEQVLYLHLADAPIGLHIDELVDEERMLPGTTGVVDVVGFLKELERIGYDGLVSAEPYNADLNALPPSERVRTASRSLSNVLQLAGVRAHENRS
jgi:sugar phosphate isomerase/epimerase